MSSILNCLNFRDKRSSFLPPFSYHFDHLFALTQKDNNAHSIADSKNKYYSLKQKTYLIRNHF